MGPMTTTTITAGDQVLIVDAGGREYRTEALSGIETDGHSFPVIWVARPLAHGGTDRVPWPAESVKPVR
jgi:hypothetical protein